MIWYNERVKTKSRIKETGEKSWRFDLTRFASSFFYKSLQMEKIKIQDESGDKRYFTIVPNYVLNHSTAVAQALYLHLKRLAGEDGVAYPASRYLRKRLGISYNTLKKEIKYLTLKGWIEFTGFEVIKTDGGRQKVRSYRIVDLWELNNKFYQRGVKIGTPSSQRGVKIGTQGVSTRGVKIGTKEEPSEEDPSFKKNNTATASEAAAGSNSPSSKFSFLGAEVIKAFEVVDPKNKTYYGNKTQRAACDFLIKEFGLDEVLRRIEVLPRTNKLPYFPKINSPHELKEKWQKLNDMIETKMAEKKENTKQNVTIAI